MIGSGHAVSYRRSIALVGGSRPGKGRIDEKAVAGKIIVFLGDVHLRVCRKNRTPQAGNKNQKNANPIIHTSATDKQARSFYHNGPPVCQVTAQRYKE